jgi:hypothetical protein
MANYDALYLGLDQHAFWAGMERCFAPLLANAEPPAGVTPVEEDIPEIELNPAPDAWPDPAAYLDP